ncbi:MAG: EamA family transporter [Candidatus Aminicenantes bacterium]|nr:EamA family transporter [Candidatus Aminicenantes bacterium]
MEIHKKFGTTDIFMLLGVIFWAINFSVIKIALREFTPLGFNGIRLVFASGILLLFLFISGEGFLVSKKDLLMLCILGLCGNTVYQMLFIHGINLTTASNSSIIIAMSPVFIAMLSSSVRHEKLNYAAWAGILISFVGFYFVVTKQSGNFQFSLKNIQGDLMIFSGILFWAVYTVFSKPLLEKISPLKLTSLTMSIGTVFYIPFCLKDVREISFGKVSFQAWAGLFYSGVFALAICYVIWYASVKRVGNSRTAIYDNLVPVLTVVFAYFSLGERITVLQAGGALIILVGVYLARSGYRWLENKE